MCRHCRTLSARTIDRGGSSPRAAFIRARKAEAGYATRLRGIARHIGTIVRGFDTSSADGALFMTTALRRYGEILEPWAKAVGWRMVTEVAQRDAKTWRAVAADMGRGLAREIETAPTGVVMRAKLADQVHLITSLPREAADRVHRLTTEGIAKGMRADRIAAEILRTEEVTTARANLIARTEVSRTAAALTQARAEHVGSEGYVWRTVKDADVRPSHRAMEGQFVRWDDPPTLDGLTGHAGCLPNCRCYPEPVIPD